MKKSILAIAMLAYGVGAMAQSIGVTDVDSYVAGEPSASLLKANATVTNNSSAAMDVMVRFEEVTAIPSGAGHYFCWTVCYSEGSINDGFETPAVHAITIDPGQSVTNFFSDYVPHGTVGVVTFRYTFFDKDNPSDATPIEITFDTQNVGIEDVFASDDSGVSESFPNPAVDEAKINYSVKPGAENAELVIYNMLGSKVKVMPLTEEQGTLRMNVSSLPAGLYFYSMVLDNQEVATKKMLVTK